MASFPPFELCHSFAEPVHSLDVKFSLQISEYIFILCDGLEYFYGMFCILQDIFGALVMNLRIRLASRLDVGNVPCYRITRLLKKLQTFIKGVKLIN